MTATAWMWVHGSALAQGLPSQGPLRLVVPAGTTSLPGRVATVLQESLSKELGRPVELEPSKQPDAPLRAAIEEVLRAPPNGLAMLVSGVEAFMSPLASKQLVPVATLAIVPYVLIAKPDVSLASLRERSGQSFFAPGFYGPLSLSALRVRNPTFVAFRAPAELKAIESVLAGELVGAIVPFGAAEPFVRAGKVKVLSVAGGGVLPKDLTRDVPPMLPGDPVILALVPATTPQRTIDYLNAVVNAALDNPRTLEGLSSLRVGAAKTSPQQAAVNIGALMGIVHDKCKVRETCEPDAACPRPCPD